MNYIKMKQTQSELEQQESWVGKYLTKENLVKAAGGALALGAAVALANPRVRQSIRAGASAMGSGTLRAPGMEAGPDASLRGRYEVALARQRARQREEVPPYAAHPRLHRLHPARPVP